jgi:hypothetical protein
MARRIAPSASSWLVIQGDPNDPLEIGGLLRIYTAAAALLVGDVVFLSAAGTVDKTVTTGTHVRAVGVVVGGTATGMTCCSDSADVATAAAAANERVLVCFSGTAFVIADAALATVGTPIAPSTTVAGRVRASTLGAGADGGKGIGKTLEVAAGAASVIKALIALSTA